MARKRRSANELADVAEAKARRAVAEFRAERAKLAKAALSTYRMAERNRFTADWRAPTTTADQASIPDLPMLQARARQLVRDNAIASSIVRSFVRNVVGRGCSPSPRVELERGLPMDDVNGRLSWLWNRWSSDPGLVDAQGRRSWPNVLAWVVSELVAVGEALVVLALSDDGAGAVNPRLQLWEAEQLSLRVKDWQGREVVGGVELDELGRPIAYHLEPAPVGVWSAVYFSDPIRIPADRVVHVLDLERANQTRGVSRFSSVGNAIRDLGEYDAAQLLAARAEACIGLVIESDGVGTAAFEPEEGEEQEPPPELEFSRMSVARMLPGERAVPFTPQRPGGSYEPFVRAQLRLIAAGVGLSYEQVARDFTQGSYSSARQAMIEDLREWGRIQSIIEDSLGRRVWQLFVGAQVLRGSVAAPGYSAEPARYESVEWAWDGHDWIDPNAEANANATALELGLDTRERILRARGLDYETVQAQRRRELLDELDLQRLSEPPPPPAETPALPAPTDQDSAQDAPTDQELAGDPERLGSPQELGT